MFSSSLLCALVTSEVIQCRDGRKGTKETVAREEKKREKRQNEMTTLRFDDRRSIIDLSFFKDVFLSSSFVVKTHPCLIVPPPPPAPPPALRGMLLDAGRERKERKRFSLSLSLSDLSLKAEEREKAKGK